jgi:alkanesulfonate monooxygenase SsuD/methylene tetrahydromethanopterin reductase-like flavin-dependent oxidoreductase (luciferase family)
VNRAEFGVFVNPDRQRIAGIEDLVRAAEVSGFDYVSVQDHPYVPGFLDTLTLLPWLAARTERIRLVPNVANLPLRPPAMLAKSSASLDALSGGRFELGLGGGRAWPDIAGLGGPRWSAGQVVEAVEDALTILRSLWQGAGPVTYRGKVFSLLDAVPGPAPAHRIPIWLGAAGPRMLGVLGRLADGWIAPISTPFDTKPEAQRTIDAAAVAAGRDPQAIRRAIQLVGSVTDRAPRLSGPLSGPGSAPIRATAENWADLIVEFLLEQRFDTVNFVPERQTTDQLARFGGEVIPRVRDTLAARRGHSATIAGTSAGGAACQ